MALKKLVEKVGGGRVEEYFCVGNKNPLLSKLSGRKDYLDNIRKELEDYCELEEQAVSGRKGIRGGPVPDRVWEGDILTDGGDINLQVLQKYVQPGPRLIYVVASIVCSPRVAEEDLNSVRQILEKVGLEKRTGEDL